MAVSIRGQRPAEAHAVPASLFLPNAPSRRIFLRSQIALNQFGPLDTALDAKNPSFHVEVENAIHAAHIEEHGFRRELLTSCSMTAGGNRELFAALAAVFK